MKMKSSWVQRDRGFSCTLDLIDLVKQIQSFQKG